jgi:hypothetical protein
MKLYYASILDYYGKEVHNLEIVGTSRHAAWNANEFINHVPPAQGFKIKIIYLSANDIAIMARDNIQL